MADGETRLGQLEQTWQRMTTDEQQAAATKLDALRTGLDVDADGPLIDRIEALHADLILTIGLQPPTPEQGFKG